MAGIYIHIPFCSRKCIYCDFFSIAGRNDTVRYVDALIDEARIRIPSCFGDSAPETVYIGGGTPSVLKPELLERLCGSILDMCGNPALSEFTIEVNPDDVDESLCRSICRAGIDRVSMGIQSFHDSDLRWMNRRHGSEDAVKAFGMLRNHGICNISIDLIFGYSMLDMEKWKYSVEKAVSLSPEHISAYQMSIEEGSMLGKLYGKGKYIQPPDNVCEQQYIYLYRTLEDAGYERYEISNFAKPGRRAIHNSSYWDGTPYLGLGASAHSYDGAGKREWNPCSIREYMNNVESLKCGKNLNGGEVLEDRDIFNEMTMTGLRRKEGISICRSADLSAEMTEELLRTAYCTNRSYSSAGHREPFIIEGDRIRIAEDCFFISDRLISDLFIL